MFAKLSWGKSAKNLNRTCHVITPCDLQVLVWPSVVITFIFNKITGEWTWLFDYYKLFAVNVWPFIHLLHGYTILSFNKCGISWKFPAANPNLIRVVCTQTPSFYCIEWKKIYARWDRRKFLHRLKLCTKFARFVFNAESGASFYHCRFNLNLYYSLMSLKALIEETTKSEYLLTKSTV